MSNILDVYEIHNTKFDKDKAWYDPNNNIIYIPTKTYGNFKYYAEGERSCINPVFGQTECKVIILSNVDYGGSFKKCNADSFGRIKIKPILHKEFLKEIRPSYGNITFEEDYVEDNAIGFIIGYK